MTFSVKSPIYATTYCNFGHRVRDGKPVAHECAILPPKMLAAEMRGDYDEANAILRAAKPLRIMQRGVKA